MKAITYVTSNKDKFQKAKTNLLPFDIELIHQNHELLEIQTNDGEHIVRHKAEQAFSIYKKPVLVNDDTWSIPALRGFPATNMKQCNDFLVADDWLRLMHGKEDRRAFFISYYGYHDGTHIHTLSNKNEMYFLNAPQGTHTKSPNLEVLAWKDSNESIAQKITRGDMADHVPSDFWKKLAHLLQK